MINNFLPAAALRQVGSICSVSLSGIWQICHGNAGIAIYGVTALQILCCFGPDIRGL